MSYKNILSNLLFFYLLSLVFSAGCPDVSECISCLSTIFDRSSDKRCFWEDNQCEKIGWNEDNKIKDLVEQKQWSSLFNPCFNEDQSIEIMDRHTFFNHTDERNQTGAFKNYEGIYAPKNFFTKWEYSFKKSYNMRIKINVFSLSENDMLSLTINSADNYYYFDSIDLISLNETKIERKSVHYFKISYFSSDEKTKAPFSIVIQTTESEKLEKTAIVIICCILAGIVVIGGIIFTLFYCLIYKKARRQAEIARNNQRNQDNQQVPLQTLPNVQVTSSNQLSTENQFIGPDGEYYIYHKYQAIKFKPGMNKFGENCTICLTDFKEGEEVAILPCGHMFHLKCNKLKDKELQSNKYTCILCKTQY